jgi:hypothetical protein
VVPDPSPFEVEIAIMALKKYKSPGRDQISAKLMLARGEILLSKIHKLILFGIRNNYLISRRILLYYYYTNLQERLYN